jgi:predicted DNA-binding transcriptional regulator AlpA
MLTLSPGQVLPLLAPTGEMSAASYVSLGRTTIYSLIKKGEFAPAVHLSAHRIGFRVADLDAWISSRMK